MKSRERLDKILSHAGWGSRKEIRQLVKSGAVRVDGQVVRDSGMKVDPGCQEIAVSGNVVEYREFVYLMMNKPPGVVSATEDRMEKTVVDLLAERYRRFRPFPAGRLDKDTTGLLLLTNDGRLAHELLSPRKKVPKTYEALVDEQVEAADIIRFREGVELDGGIRTLPAELEILEPGGPSGPTRVRITLTEGKYHQIKRMFRAVGKTVVALKREQIGALRLDESLPPGGYRELSPEEVRALRNVRA